MNELVFEKTIYIDASTVNEDDMVFRGEVLFNNTNSQELVGKTVLFDGNIAQITLSN